jgi:single-strand DNA-binding protein
MSDYNRVILLGRIGNDLELKSSAQGTKYLKLSLATNHHRAGQEKTTHWHRVMVFGSQAELCSTYLQKGSQVMVEGMLEVRSYSDKEGQKRTSVSVLADRVRFVGGRPAAEAEGEREAEANAA